MDNTEEDCVFVSPRVELDSPDAPFVNCSYKDML